MNAFSIVQDLLIPLAEYPSIRMDSALHDAFEAIEHGLATGKRYRHVLVVLGLAVVTVWPLLGMPVLVNP